MRMKELGAGRGVGHQCRGKWVPVILKSQKGEKKEKKKKSQKGNIQKKYSRIEGQCCVLI